MIRVALTADNHTNISGRQDEARRVHYAMLDEWNARGVHCVGFCGDLTDQRMNEEQRLWLDEFLTEVAKHRPVFIVGGNHDLHLSLRIFGHLKTENKIYVEDQAAIHIVETAAGPIAVAAVAWPRKGEVLARYADASREQSQEIAVEALRNMFLGLGAQLREWEMPSVAMVHGMIRASKVSTGQPLCGQDFEIGLEILTLLGAQFYCVGHVHCPQDWTYNNVPVVIPGSPFPTAFGETEQKSWVLAEFDNSGLMKWERVPTPATPMLLIEFEFVPGGEPTFNRPTENVRGAEVRMRYRAPSDYRDQAKAAAQHTRMELLMDGALEVKLEEVVIPTTRARTPEIAAAQSLADKVKVLWNARGDVPDPERQERLLAKLNQIESEAVNG